MKKHILTEDDLVEIFTSPGKPGKKEARRRRYFLYPLVLVAFYASVFVAINFNSIYSNLRFWYFTEYKNEPFNELTADGNQTDPSAYANHGNPERISPNIPHLENSHLRIPSINVTAPITWEIENQPGIVKSNLQNGLIHIKGTALPGSNGNVFVTGHSSDLPWAKGNYKTVFALLGHVVIGDVVHINYQDKDYLYKVSEIKTVQPTDVSVMQSTENPSLSLMTCTPVGTTLRRLVVISKQVYPDPTNNQPGPGQNHNAQLPKTR
ncbi:MAG: Sortase family protein [bacterium ADurb.Bin400]|nr:MAG: Sortase family protein [bacterium ADurb.Bin400]